MSKERSEVCMEAILYKLLDQPYEEAEVVGCEMMNNGRWRLVVQVRPKGDPLVRTFIVRQDHVQEVYHDLPPNPSLER